MLGNLPLVELDFLKHLKHNVFQKIEMERSGQEP